MGGGGGVNREGGIFNFLPLKRGEGTYLRAGDLEKIYGSLFTINKIIKMLKMVRAMPRFLPYF